MKLLTKIIAGVLLGIGLPISLYAVSEIFNPETDDDDRSDAVAALIIVGLPPTTLGSWLIWNARRQQRQQEIDRLRTAFFQLLQAGDGHLTVLQYSMATGLDGTAAKAYLDERATEFQATFEVSEQGGVSYYFDLGKRLEGS